MAGQMELRDTDIRSLDGKWNVTSVEKITTKPDLFNGGEDYLFSRYWTSQFNWSSVFNQSLQGIKSSFETLHVKLPKSGQRIWTITLNKRSQNLPLVMVHGMGGGIGLWAQNLDTLATKRPVYAFDLLGFGRSSRPKFPGDAEHVETQFVESIEEWREEMKIDKMVLLGHSLGAYIVSAYALKYPEKIQHLFLVDPWGYPKQLPPEEYREIPLRYRIIGKLASPFNPLAIMRVAGPWGPGLVKRFRGDLQAKFSELFDDDTIPEYIYHCNAQKPSGEAAFKALSVGLGWARNPMLLRVGNIDKHLPMTFIYGAETWMDKTCGHQTKEIRSLSHVDVKVIKGAGHHVYADEAETFNRVLTRCLDDIDKHIDNDPKTGTDETGASVEQHREQMPLTQI